PEELEELRRVVPRRRARGEQPARAQGTARLGDRDPRVVEVIKHPQRGDGAEARFPDRTAAGIGEGSRKPGSTKQCHGPVEPDPRPAARELHPQRAITATHVEYGSESFSFEASRHHRMYIAD